MNLKIENQNLRFKISENELKKLLLKEILGTKATFLDNKFIVSILPFSSKNNIELKSTLEENLEEKKLEQNCIYLNLSITEKEIQKLVEMGKSRLGIKFKIEEILVSLQVDMRDDSRKTSL